MTSPETHLHCRSCGGTIDAAGPVVALAGANGFTGPAFIPFAEQSPTLGTGGVEHVGCYVRDHGHRAFAELLHAPKARAMDQP